MTTLYIKDSACGYKQADDANIIEGARQVLRTSALKQGAEITSAAYAAKILETYLHGDIEIFGCLYLDGQNHVIEFAELFTGTVDKAAVFPREVVKKALLLGASAIILCHNHPSGNPKPSSEDEKVTKAIKEGCKLLEIKVLDHIIVANDNHYSFMESGIL